MIVEMTVEQAMQLAMQLYTAGRLAEAEAVYRQVLAAAPQQSDALSMLGNIAMRVGQPVSAAKLLSRAVAIQPRSPVYRNTYGLTLVELTDLEDAEQQFRTAIELQPDYVGAWQNLGNTLRLKGQLVEALEVYLHILSLDPDNGWALSDVADVLTRLKRCEEAVGYAAKATKLMPSHPGFHNNLSAALVGLGRTSEALEACRTAVRLSAGAPPFNNNLGICLMEQGCVNQAIEAFCKAVEAAPNVAAYRSAYLYALQFDPTVDSQTLLREHQRWDQFHSPAASDPTPTFANDPTPQKRLRIGYVSADLRAHPVGRFMLPLLRNHDRTQFEVFAYTSDVAADEISAECRARCDHWKVIDRLSDDAAAQLIRAHRIDILVDLAAHSSGNRLAIFARKPAPVQVTYLAYPGTTGLKAIDYRITDPYLDPPDAPSTHYSEASIRLPETYWCYEPGTDTPAVAPLPAENTGAVTFGCLNAFRKISEAAQQTWAKLLKQVQGSRLIVHARDGAHRDLFTEILRGEGISTDRVEFLGFVPIEYYFHLYSRIDIGLDSFPTQAGRRRAIHFGWVCRLLPSPVIAPCFAAASVCYPISASRS